MDDLYDRRDSRPRARNVLGGLLLPCSVAPLTGFFRDGCCTTGPDDVGLHAVCAEMTAAFLAFSRARGNDLSTPRPEFGFAGLHPGDRWCLCAARWEEARRAGVAPPVLLEATHEAALRVTTRDHLLAHAVGE
ncbi:DUF2237 domain-containing protein [Roseomonas eburnea]|uniref:DUF2237 domain-containing protein n=1 Tax=Neoroseomonas eburnea TaxID=1346889 RepID=A0A9X9XJU6_9PROT|nr:DUF2237 domain-containing protein [Neoroseomonas eburnea]MBR0683982.1 DUF2237 domain-containing protein [Neoroseomonas eburnea]